MYKRQLWRGSQPPPKTSTRGSRSSDDLDLGREPTVLFDSGLRTGADLFVALALGADACLLGRPHIYGLALDGSDGVAAVVANVLAELDLTMGLTGVASIADLVPGLLTRA